MNSELNTWQQWVQQPQHVWLRKAFFQIHLWTGVGISLYVILISVSGSAVVFGRELTLKFGRKPVYISGSGPRLTTAQIKEHVQLLYPDYRVTDVLSSRRADQPLSVSLEHNSHTMMRLVDPFTGADMGDPLSPQVRFIEWMVDLHDNLLGGATGRKVNGIGAIFVTVIALSGAVVWWPGKKEWRRSLKISWQSNFPRLTWDLHSAMGFWCYLYVVLWGISGIYLCFPDPFNYVSDRIFPVPPHSRQLPIGEKFLFWITRLHFGRFGWQLETLWVILGLAPAAMAVTGLLMWWNRSLRKMTFDRFAHEHKVRKIEATD